MRRMIKMTVYYSEKPFTKEIIDHLRKLFPRRVMDSNYLEVSRADNIDYNLFLKYFNCAVAKKHNLYEVALTLPTDLEDRIPFWFVQSDGEIWVDPNSGPKGKNIYGQNFFVIRFHLYVNEENIHKFDEIKNETPEKAMIGEFEEIRYALINREEEPIEIF